VNDTPTALAVVTEALSTSVAEISKWSIVAFLAVGSLAGVALIGTPAGRKPPAVVVSLVINVVMIVAIVVFWRNGCAR